MTYVLRDDGKRRSYRWHILDHARDGIHALCNALPGEPGTPWARREESVPPELVCLRCRSVSEGRPCNAPVVDRLSQHEAKTAMLQWKKG